MTSSSFPPPHSRITARLLCFPSSPPHFNLPSLPRQSSSRSHLHRASVPLLNLAEHAVHLSLSSRREPCLCSTIASRFQNELGFRAGVERKVGVGEWVGI
ncbi:hypothetical protein Droror1_Dr00002882 [Drosera rotundifolia]